MFTSPLPLYFCLAAEEEAYWKRHRNHHLPGARRTAVYAEKHPVPLPARLHHCPSAQPLHWERLLQVRHLTLLSNMDKKMTQIFIYYLLFYCCFIDASCIDFVVCKYVCMPCLHFAILLCYRTTVAVAKRKGNKQKWGHQINLFISSLILF